MINQVQKSTSSTQNEVTINQEKRQNHNSTDTLLMELLDKNDQNFDIFFSEKNFHNHCVHHLLAAYSLGASKELLNKIYRQYEETMRPKLPSKIKITQENWLEYLGQEDLWTDYLVFFKEIVAEKGIQQAFETYAMHPKMFPRMFEKASHPIIHLGYGIEFQIPLIVAEGLAQIAVHADRMKGVFIEEIWEPQEYKGKKVLDVIQEIQSDQCFEKLFSHSGDFMMNVDQLVLTKFESLKKYASAWVIRETEEDIEKATKELYDVCILLVGATAVRPDKSSIRVDFFLIHGLTSMLFVYHLLPHFSLHQKIKLLQAQFATVLSFYVFQGRPKLHLNTLKQFVPKDSQIQIQSWSEIIQTSLEIPEAHAIKCVRAVLKAEQEWGTGDENLYFKVAQIIIAGYKGYGWSYNGLGWNEEWGPSE